MASLLPVVVLALIFGTVTKQAYANRDVVLTVGGLVAPVFTSFDENGNLNLDIIDRYSRHIKSYGLDGVLLTGTAGECDKLTVSEKKRFYESWLRAARLVGLKVMVQVSGIPLPDAQELARYAESIGVDAILALPELYYKPTTVKELVYFMQCIANAAPNTPVLYYDIPSYSNVNVDLAKFVEEATAKISNFKGIKTEDFDNALQLRNKLRGDQRLFIADSKSIAPAALMGFENFIMGELNMFPDLLKKIIREGQSCEQRQVKINNDKLQDYKNAIESQGRSRIPAFKEAMSLVTGIKVGDVRDPQIPLTDRQKKELESSLRRRGIQLRCYPENDQYDD